MTGVIVNCLAVNVYQDQSETSEILEQVSCISDVEILDDISMNGYTSFTTDEGVFIDPPHHKDFIKVMTESGVIGYVNKKFIAIREEEL